MFNYCQELLVVNNFPDNVHSHKHKHLFVVQLFANFAARNVSMCPALCYSKNSQTPSTTGKKEHVNINIDSIYISIPARLLGN